MDEGEEQEETKLTSLISPDTFLNVFEVGDPGTIENEVVEAQRQYKAMMDSWSKRLPIEKHEGIGTTMWTDRQG